MPADTLDFDGVTVTTADGTKSITTREIGTKMVVGPRTNQLVGFASWGSHTSPPPFMASIAEVSVDTETGLVTPIDFYSVVDCGTIVNPVLAKVQAEGGIVQGIGMALYE